MQEGKGGRNTFGRTVGRGVAVNEVGLWVLECGSKHVGDGTRETVHIIFLSRSASIRTASRRIRGGLDRHGRCLCSLVFVMPERVPESAICF